MDICVFTDFRFLTQTSMTGVGKHIVQMVQGLSRIDGNRLTALAARDQSRDLGALSALPVRPLPLPWKVAEAIWTVTGRPLADRWCGRPDWVYCPKNDFIAIRQSRVAVTIHGAHELDPQMPQPRTMAGRLNQLRRRTSYGRIFQQASLVLTVSEFLKRQMTEWFRVPPERIRVVGNGVEPEFYQPAGPADNKSEGQNRRPFVLCVGGLNHLDGGDRMLGAARLLQRRMPDLEVLVAGCQHDEALEQAAADLPNLRLLGYVKSEQLARLMPEALALFFPTRYETFGIAAAEAMAAGTPVVTCRSTAVPEVVGDAGLYVDPDQPEAVVEAVLALQGSRGLRDGLVACGRQRAENYRWSACVARLQQALEGN